MAAPDILERVVGFELLHGADGLLPVFWSVAELNAAADTIEQ